MYSQDKLNFDSSISGKILTYSIVEFVKDLRTKTDTQVSIFTIGKSGGVVGYRYCYNSVDKFSKYDYGEAGHNPFELGDVIKYMTKKVLANVVKESLNNELQSDTVVEKLFLDNEIDFVEYVPEIYVYQEDDEYVYTMKERK
ncbi:hypothetical protein VP424E501_P0172 [Vibrio phage 424E50-1]|nr:hypothetical protein VP424E501_P0172 [Vibrio phage 424E50-1]